MRWSADTISPARSPRTARMDLRRSPVTGRATPSWATSTGPRSRTRIPRRLPMGRRRRDDGRRWRRPGTYTRLVTTDAELVFLHGPVHVGDPAPTPVGGLAVRDGRVVAVAARASGALLGSRTEVA